MNIPKEYSNWKPDPQDIAWAENMLSLGNDKFTWAFPSAMAIYQIDKTNKTIQKTVGSEDENYWRTVICFKAVGYRMIEDSAFAE